MPTGTVLYGPSFEDLRRESLSRADSLAGDGPERVVFIEENTYQQEAIADAWANAYRPVRLTVTELSSFVSRVHERLFGPVPGVGTLDRRRVIEQALDIVDQAGLLPDARNHADAFSELFREIEADGLCTPAAVRTRLEETGLAARYVDPVAAAFAEYVELRGALVHPDAIPRSRKATAITDADRSLREVLPTVDVVVISGLLDPSTVEQGLLRRLATEFDVLCVLAQTTDSARPGGAQIAVRETRAVLESIGYSSEYLPLSADLPLLECANALFTAETAARPVAPFVSWHRAPTPDREVRHVARHIRADLAENGFAPDDVLVLAPGLLSYREQIADSFTAAGVEYAMNLGVFLEHTYAGRAVLDAVRLCDQPSAEHVTSLASNPLVDLPDVNAAELTDVARRLYTSELDRFHAELDQSYDGVDALLNRVRSVRTSPASAVVSGFQQLLAQLGVGDPDSVTIDGNGSAVAYERRA